MGWLSKIKKAISVAVEVAPSLPIPQKAKNVVAKAGHAEQDVEDIIREVKPPKPAA